MQRLVYSLYFLVVISVVLVAPWRVSASSCGPIVVFQMMNCGANQCAIGAICRTGCSGGGSGCGPGSVYADVSEACEYDYNKICATGWSCSDPERCGGGIGYVEAAVYAGGSRISWEKYCCQVE